MCGHGTIGTVTMAIEQEGAYVEEVRITNVASFLHSGGIEVECPGLGRLTVDVAYGGNFYAIVDPQKNFRDMSDFSAAQLIQFSSGLRGALNESCSFEHPTHPEISGLSHILWTGAPKHPQATAYGDRPQRGVLWRQGDRSFAVRHRHIGQNGAVGGIGPP